VLSRIKALAAGNPPPQSVQRWRERRQDTVSTCGSARVLSEEDAATADGVPSGRKDVIFESIKSPPAIAKGPRLSLRLLAARARWRFGLTRLRALEALAYDLKSIFPERRTRGAPQVTLRLKQHRDARRLATHVNHCPIVATTRLTGLGRERPDAALERMSASPFRLSKAAVPLSAKLGHWRSPSKYLRWVESGDPNRRQANDPDHQTAPAARLINPLARLALPSPPARTPPPDPPERP
jgi:hypothetical protein